MHQKKVRGFTLRMPNKLRGKLSYWLLNWAEKQKVAKETNWFLFELQQYRLAQHNIANTIYKQTRPPEGTKIEFIGFRLIEVFHYEDFEKVYSGLKNMFPDLEKSGNHFLENFEKSIETMTAGLWNPVGTLYCDIPRIYGGARVARQISTIHSSVETIDVELQKILPSMLVISFDVKLKNNATDQINELQSQKHLGNSSFEGITFGKYPFVNITLSSSESIMTTSVSELISNIRENVENVIKPYLKGYFLSKYSNKHHLPSIEAYILSRKQKNQRDFSAWIKLAAQWGRSLGFYFSSSSSFGNNELVFSWRNSERSVKFNNAHKIFVFSEKFLERPNSIWQDLKYLFIETTPLIAIVEYLDDSQGILEKMRRQIFNAMGRSHDLSQYIQLYQSFQVLGRALQRLNLEIEQKMLFNWSNSFYKITELLEIQINKENKRVRKSEKNTFVSDGQDRIKFLYKILSEHVAFMDKAFSTHIEFLNIDAVYRLQKLTLWLTIVATVATIIGILLNFSELVKLFEGFILYFKGN